MQVAEKYVSATHKRLGLRSLSALDVAAIEDTVEDGGEFRNLCKESNAKTKTKGYDEACVRHINDNYLVNKLREVLTTCIFVRHNLRKGDIQRALVQHADPCTDFRERVLRMKEHIEKIKKCALAMGMPREIRSLPLTTENADERFVNSYREKFRYKTNRDNSLMLISDMALHCKFLYDLIKCYMQMQRENVFYFFKHTICVSFSKMFRTLHKQYKNVNAHLVPIIDSRCPIDNKPAAPFVSFNNNNTDTRNHVSIPLPKGSRTNKDSDNYSSSTSDGSEYDNDKDDDSISSVDEA